MSNKQEDYLRAVAGNADSLESSWLRWDDDSWWCASVVEELGKSHANSSDISLSNTERGGGKSNLLDEVTDLSAGLC